MPAGNAWERSLHDGFSENEYILSEMLKRQQAILQALAGQRITEDMLGEILIPPNQRFARIPTPDDTAAQVSADDLRDMRANLRALAHGNN